MLNVSSPMSREQFRLLREAKSLIKEEFNEVVNLQDESILVMIYNFALESKDEKLFSIHEQLQIEVNGKDNQAKTAVTKKSSNSKEAPTVNTQGKKVKVGDIIDGQKCVSIYRGNPVFKPI